MIGYVLGNNHTMLGLCQSLGFAATENVEDPALKCVTLVLND